MSNETLNNTDSETLINNKIPTKGSCNKVRDLSNSVLNINLNKISENKFDKKKIKICVNKLQKRLRKKKNQEIFGSRIFFSLFFSLVAVLFYIYT